MVNQICWSHGPNSDGPPRPAGLKAWDGLAISIPRLCCWFDSLGSLVWVIVDEFQEVGQEPLDRWKVTAWVPIPVLMSRFRHVFLEPGAQQCCRLVFGPGNELAGNFHWYSPWLLEWWRGLASPPSWRYESDGTSLTSYTTDTANFPSWFH